tara:strand:- start:4390 stop:4581 length:192 start_codon:yes stop_codon:yes gene_type:complete
MKVSELRVDFERAARNSFFNLERNEHNEYQNAATLGLWAGYWMAAKDHGIIPEDSTWLNAHTQ